MANISQGWLDLLEQLLYCFILAIYAAARRFSETIRSCCSS